VSAADAREHLEATMRRAIAHNAKCTTKGKCAGCESNIDDTLIAADEYAQAYAADFAAAVLDGATRDKCAAERREVLADALKGK
jgi:ferredoxin